MRGAPRELKLQEIFKMGLLMMIMVKKFRVRS